MTSIPGLLGLEDGDDALINTIGQSVAYEAANEYFRLANIEMMNVYDLFIESETEDYKRRYKTPGGGFLEELGPKTKSANIRAYGSWDIALPLKNFGRAIGYDWIEAKKATVQELNRSVEGLQIANINTLRFEILKRLFNNTQTSFVDDRKGTLLIEPLANGDTVTYPPIAGATSEATEDHYLVSTYTSANISNDNNPYSTIVDELEEHPGASGSQVVIFINKAQRKVTEALADFYPSLSAKVTPGDDTDQVSEFGSIPGKLIGICNDAWIVKWDFVPAGWILATNLSTKAPLLMRRDPANEGFVRGLTLESFNDDHPLQSSQYSHRFGIGAGNRLNGVVMELKASGSYSVPTTYA